MSAEAPGWMHRARRLAEALEEAISRADITASTEASVERAWAAWELADTSDAEIAKVASVVQHAHRAIRGTERAELAQAVNDCAEVLKSALPPHVSEHTPFEDIVDLVRALKAEADPWMAVLTVTSALLGWAEAGRAHAARAIRVALDADHQGQPHANTAQDT
ncbi:MAG: hypothetical protein KIT72_11020 [Polyangiaceae bacterium]|nr:hypothetical protein [Polyangiaceae bacterium]